MTVMGATVTGLVSHLAGHGLLICSCAMRQELFHSTGKQVPCQAACSPVLFSFYIGHVPSLRYTPVFVSGLG